MVELQRDDLRAHGVIPTTLAIDVGGTKMAAAVLREGVLVERSTAPTPLHDDPEVVWDTLQGVVEAALGSRAVELVGVGCGGPMEPGGESVSPLNIPGWRGFPLRQRLRDLLGAEVWVDNDAKALALGEGWLGAASGQPAFIALIVGTGVGGGIVLDGRLLDGRSGNAGHIGHVIVEPDGRPCACGARGCLEAEASGPSIEALTGLPPDLADETVRARTGMLVGRAVASVANLLDLPLAVAGGSVALGFGEPFFAAAQAELDRSCRLDFSRGTVIRPVGLGADAPLVGAAAVALHGAGVLPGVRSGA